MRQKCFLKDINIDKERNVCKGCKNNNCLIQNPFFVIYKGVKFSWRDWYSRLATFVKFDDTCIKLKSPGINLSNEEIKHFFLKNVKKYTFLGNILPAIVFSIISLVSFTASKYLQENRNFGFIEEENMMPLFVWFIGAIFFLVSIILIYFVLIRKQKIYYCKKRSQNRYTVLEHDSYLKMLEIFDINIEKEYINFPPISDSYLLIREFKKSDTKDYYEIFKNPNVFKYMMTNEFISIEEAYQNILKLREQYKENTIQRLAIYDKRIKKVIGFIGLSKYDLTVNTCQVVYALGEEYWHKGYMKKALDMFVEYLFSIGKTLIIAGHVKDNVNSGKVLEKCGFIRDEARDTKLIIHNETKEIYNYVLSVKKIN